MAKNNFKKLNAIKDTEGGGFGQYSEENGGGTPRGGVWGGKSGRVGWDERQKSGELPQNAHRQKQARTSDGKFTYASVNGKETKYESRGKTVNPLLTGGVNGIKIEDAKQQFASKQGSLYDKYKDKWYQKGSELITKEGRSYKIKLAQNDIWEIARVSFNLQEGGFTTEAQNFANSKSGRHSKEEKEAIQEAKKNKGETFVKDNTGALQQKAGSGQGQQLSTGITFQLNPGVIARFRALQAVKQAAVPGAGTATFGQAAQAPANGPATQLKGMQKAVTGFSPNLLKNLGTMVPGVAIPVAQTKAPAPKVNIGGLSNFKKKTV